MHRIEILTALFSLQLLILSTGTHFQRVSEHYMVTRTFLSIFSSQGTINKQTRPAQRPQLQCGVVGSTIQSTRHRVLASFFLPGIVDPPRAPKAPPLPPKWQKNKHPHFSCSDQTTTTPISGKNSFVKNYIYTPQGRRGIHLNAGQGPRVQVVKNNVLICRGPRA